jgi:hypothetical protein
MTRLRRPATKRFSLPPMIWFNRSALSGGAALVRGLAEVRLNDIAAAAMMDDSSTTPTSTLSGATSTAWSTTTSAAAPTQPTVGHDNHQGANFQPSQRGPKSTVVDTDVGPADGRSCVRFHGGSRSTLGEVFL